MPAIAATITLYDDGTYTANPPIAPAVVTPPAPKPFTTSGAQILDPAGKPFVAQGFAHMLWGGYRASDLDLFATTGANAIRCCFSTTMGTDTPAERRAVVEKLLGYGIVPIVCEGWDGPTKTTKQTDPAPFRATVQHWLAPEMAAVLKDHPQVWLNIANEWGPDSAVWRDEYVAAIKLIRAAGITNLLLIDTGNRGAPGSCPETIKTYGADVFAADPIQKVAFSIHMYNQWFTESPTEAADLAKYPNSRWDVRTELAKIQSPPLGLPVIVGEFTSQKYTNPNVYYDPALILKACHDLGVGYQAWSWANNGNSAADMWWTNPTTGKQELKAFGRLIVDDLKATAKPAGK